MYWLEIPALGIKNRSGNVLISSQRIDVYFLTLHFSMLHL